MNVFGEYRVSDCSDTALMLVNILCEFCSSFLDCPASDSCLSSWRLLYESSDAIKCRFDAGSRGQNTGKQPAMRGRSAVKEEKEVNAPATGCCPVRWCSKTSCSSIVSKWRAECDA